MLDRLANYSLKAILQIVVGQEQGWTEQRSAIQRLRKGMKDRLDEKHCKTNDDDLTEYIKKRYQLRCRPSDYDGDPQFSDPFLEEARQVLEEQVERVPYASYPEFRRTKSLVQTAELSALKQMSTAIGSPQATATFACGGKIPIKETSQRFDAQLACSSVTIRWDSASLNGGAVQLPMHSKTSGHESFGRLLEDCKAATFGRLGHDMLDEPHRKVGRLDETQFSTDFNPYTLGIIDAVHRVLLPNIWIDEGNESSVDLENLGIVAKLSKLNVRLLTRLLPRLKSLTHIGLFHRWQTPLTH